MCCDFDLNENKVELLHTGRLSFIRLFFLFCLFLFLKDVRKLLSTCNNEKKIYFCFVCLIGCFRWSKNLSLELPWLRSICFHPGMVQTGFHSVLQLVFFLLFFLVLL
jgi:hypothetical protein